MDRRNLCMAIVTVMLLSTSFIAGCTDPFHPVRICPQCGCHYYGTEFEPTGQAILNITGTDLAHKGAFESTNYFLALPTTDYMLKVYQVVPATNKTPEQVVYNFSFKGPTDVSPAFKVPWRTLSNYTVSLQSESTDTYLNNRTFFNGSNQIKVKLWNDSGGLRLNVTVDPPVPGVSVEPKLGTRNILWVQTAQWNFDIEVRNSEICVD